MPDPTGGMFEARLALKDEASEPIERINDNIEKAVGASGKLKKGLGDLGNRLDNMYKATKKVNADTNKIGIVGAALFGVKGKGSIDKQAKGITGMLGKMGKAMRGAFVNTLFTLGDAALYAAEKAAFLASVMSGHFFLAKFPKIAAAAGVETLQLIPVIEELRHAIVLTNNEAAEMGDQISSTMLNTSANIEKVMGAYKDLADLGIKPNTAHARDLADATVYMSEAWRMGTAELAGFNRQLTELYQVGRGNVLGVASAMDYVARTTAIARQDLMLLVQGLQNDLILRIPKDMRTKVMPKLLADISAIAGEWKNIFGNPEELMRGVKQIIDPFNEEGQKLRATIIGFGGATEEAMQKLAKDRNIAGMVLAQTQAVANLRDSLGEEQFLATASVYADLMGIATDEYLRMDDAAVKAMKARMALAEEELKSTKSIREAWDRAKGIFNEVWNSLENIGKAILISIGEPMLAILVPIFDKIGKGLQWIVSLFQNVGDTAKGLTKTVVSMGTMAAVLAAISALSTVLSIALTAIGAALVFLAPLFLVVGKFAAGLGLIIVALISHWDDFYAAFEPGITIIKKSIADISAVFQKFKERIAEALGTASGDTKGFGEVVTVVLKTIATALGLMARVVAAVISYMMDMIIPFIEVFMWGVTPVIDFGVAVFNVFSGIFGMVKDTIEMVLVLTGLMTGNASEIGKSMREGLETMLKGLIGILMTPVDWIYSTINLAIKALNSLPGIEIDLLPNLGTQVVGMVSLKEGGITTQDNVKANLHANEAIIPLEKFPEIVGSTVHIDQESVVAELQYHRKILERISRSGGMSSIGSGG